MKVGSLFNSLLMDSRSLSEGGNYYNVLETKGQLFKQNLTENAVKEIIGPPDLFVNSGST